MLDLCFLFACATRTASVRHLGLLPLLRVFHSKLWLASDGFHSFVHLSITIGCGWLENMRLECLALEWGIRFGEWRFYVLLFWSLRRCKKKVIVMRFFRVVGLVFCLQVEMVMWCWGGGPRMGMVQELNGMLRDLSGEWVFYVLMMPKLSKEGWELVVDSDWLCGDEWWWRGLFQV